MKRRAFIQTSALSAVSVLAMPSLLHAAVAKSKIGIQLYTLKDVIFKDPKDVLDKLASFGYKELETFAHADGKLYGLTRAEFGKHVKDLGMKVVSGHYGIELVQKDWEKSVADAKELGQKYMVLPWLDESYRNADKMKGVCETLNKAGEVCKKYGMTMAYHNHDFEFKEDNGKLLYDILLEELDPKIVELEMDLYWVVYAGYDPLRYFEKHPGRFTQWHVKDMDREVRNRNTEVGNGAIDFKAIFAKAKQSGMKHFFVEQEYFSGSPIDSARISIDNLKKIV